MTDLDRADFDYAKQTATCDRCKAAKPERVMPFSSFIAVCQPCWNELWDSRDQSVRERVAELEREGW